MSGNPVTQPPPQPQSLGPVEMPDLSRTVSADAIVPAAAAAAAPAGAPADGNSDGAATTPDLTPSHATIYRNLRPAPQPTADATPPPTPRREDRLTDEPDIFLDDSGQPRILRGVAVYSGATRLAEM